MRIVMLCGTLLLLGATVFWTRSDSGDESAEAVLLNGNGERIGHATLSQTLQGVRIKVVLSKLEPGMHAMHIHTVGDCHGADFKSAGAHFNPYGKRHGQQNKDGPHAGDLPNFEARADGTAEVDVTTVLLTLRPGKNSLFPSGKTCLVIHEDPDDEVTDPTGNAGKRVACGVILKN